MRITQKLVDRIILSMGTSKDNPYTKQKTLILREIREELNCIIRAYCSKHYPKEVLQLMDCTQADELFVALTGGHYIHAKSLSIQEAENEGFTIPKWDCCTGGVPIFTPYWVSWNLSEVINDHSDGGAELLKLIRRSYDIDRNRRAALGSIGNCIRGFNTVKQLLEVYPDFAPFVPKEPVKACKNLPSTRTDNTITQLLKELVRHD